MSTFFIILNIIKPPLLFVFLLYHVIFENVYNLGAGALKSAITASESVEDTTSVEDTAAENLNGDTTVGNTAE